MISSSYSFEGKLITGPESFLWIKNALNHLDGDASICSAYIKLSIMREIEQNTRTDNIRFLARWDLNDLVGGASDIECYKFAKDQGWKFFINRFLHAKIYSLPPSGILSGSANATNSGLGLSPQSNREASTIVSMSDSNLAFINCLFSESILMTDELYSEIIEAFNAADKSKSFVQWPDSVMSKLNPNITQAIRFMFSECLLSDGSEILNLKQAKNENSIHDLSILAVPLNFFDSEYIANKFIYSKQFLWTKSLLKKYQGEIYFGTLTSELHNALIEDPTPYRSEVKELVKNIYSWIKFIGPDKTKVVWDRPNVSERLRLVE
jgi:hypothetical protein